MTLAISPNKTTPTSIREGDNSWPVYALQTGVNALGYACIPDGTFGPMTKIVVQEFQTDRHLTSDGVAGPITQGEIVMLLDGRTHSKFPHLPSGLIRGFAMTESGNYLGAVNWNISGGVDCGVVQVRCFGPPFDGFKLREAFDPSKSMTAVATEFTRKTEAFFEFPFAKLQAWEWSMRCAALSWNWPWAAEQFASRGKLPDPSRNATWAVVGGQRIKFPDGTPVVTYDDWARFYALGGKHGEGRVTRYVTDWSK